MKFLKMRQSFWFPLLVGLAFLASLLMESTFVPGFADQPEQNQMIQQALSQALIQDVQPTSDSPFASAPIYVTKIYVSGSYALASWTWSEVGGWALLSYNGQNWQLIERGGDLLSPDALVELGVPADQAALLMHGFDPNWNNFTPIEQAQ